MKKKSFIIALASVVMIAAVAIGGTVAFFSATSDTVKNTFTLGKVDISLREEAVEKGPDGNWINVVGVDTQEIVYTNDGNKYTDVYPGAVLPKKAEIVVDDDSEDCYLRMKITVCNWDAINQLIKFSDTDEGVYDYSDCVNVNPDWTFQKFVEKTGKNRGMFYMTYNKPVLKSDADKVIVAPFTDIKIPLELTSEEADALNNFKIIFEAHAMQKMAFEDADAAWAAFDAK